MAIQTKPKYPGVEKPLVTKIVGTTFEGRQGLLKAAAEHDIRLLKLVRDPDNPYDPNAVAVEAPVYKDGVEVQSVRLGFISNSDRMCIVCGKMVDGLAFSRTRTVKCPRCGNVSQYTTKGMMTCPSCKDTFDTDAAKTVTCPTCLGDEWVRDGLATLVARAMDEGIEYQCRVLEYTGGETDPKTGKTKTRGCNIQIEQLKKDQPV